MKFITRKAILSAIGKFEKLSIDELSDKQLFGFTPDAKQLRFLLHQLIIRSHILVLHGDRPVTYILTPAGLAENDRLRQLQDGGC
jgi:hypothetical protein